MSHEPSKLQKVLNIYGIVLILWSFYRVHLGDAGIPEWFDELIAKPFVFLVPTYVYLKYYEGGNIVQGLTLRSKKFLSDVWLGLGIGLAFIVSAGAAHIVKHGGIDASILSQSPVYLIVGLSLATATVEEVFARGFLLKRMYEDSKGVYTSAFNTSILFLILHIPMLFTIPELRGNMLLIFLATDFILSLVNSFVYLDRRSVIAPILIHALYNIALIMYI